MGDDDERTRAIIERARLRKEELDAEDEKGSSISDQSLETPATLHVTKKVTWSAECLSTPETPEPDTDTPPKSECTLTRRKIFAELSAEYDEYNIDYSPIRTVALENAATKKILPVLEERIRETPVKNLPMPKLPGDAIASSKPKTPAKSLWKASTNVPVVVGARPGEPTRADVCPASLKSLKERWEVSSMTGTPLHPDDTKEDLIQAAMKRRESLNPKKMKTRATEQTGSSSITKAERSITSSPIAKSPRCEVVSPASQRSPAASSPTSDLSPVAKDDDHPDNLDSEPNYSKAIDEAFDFMTGSPIRTPSRGDSPINYHSPMDDAKKFERSEAGKGLHYTLSYYRQRTRQEQSSVSSSEKVDLSINHSVSSPPTSSEDLSSEPEVDIGERKKHLQNVIFTQQTKSGQALKALQLCRNKAQFRGSHEEATAQWAILIESELGRAAEEELERLNSQELFVRTGPFGSLTLSNIIVELNRDFIDRNSHYRSEEVFYFCIILRSGEQVLHSAIISSEDAVKRGFIEVAPPMALKNLPRDFTASLDVYSFRTIRGHYTHEEKFGLKGSSTTKHKSASRPTSSSAGRGDSCFVPVGKLPLDINIPNGKKRLQLSDVTYPLGGHVSIKIKKVATRLTTGNHSGFLSLFHRPGEGLGSWTRYWCVLESGGMKFWRQPEDAAQNKKWIVILDLTTCAGEKEGASENNDPGQYLNPFHIDVWIPKNESSLNQTECGEMEKFRILLSADTKDDMHAWLNAINSSVDVLRSWT